MLETTADEFRKTLKKKVDTCIKNHEVLKVQRRTGANFVIFGEEDWRSIEDTIYLNRVPGLVESIPLPADISCKTTNCLFFFVFFVIALY